MTLNDLLVAARALGDEQLVGAAVVNGRAVRFAVIAVNAGERAGELELVMECRSWEGPPT